MKYIIVLSVIFALFTCPVNGQDVKFRPGFSVIFDSSKGQELLKQCSRSSPHNVSGYWTPKQNDIDTLEKNFAKIYPNDCCKWGGKTDSLSRFGIQFLGVIINGKKSIYLNAFPLGMLDEMKRDMGKFDPQKDPVTVCDGGASFWGALFNIETKMFSELSFNGVA